MDRKPIGAADRKGKPVHDSMNEVGSSSDHGSSDDDVLGDLIDSDFDVFVEDDGRVKIHAKCDETDEPAACAARMRFLVEALGGDFVMPPELPR